MAVKGSLAVLTKNVEWPETTTLMAAVQLELGISASGYFHKESTVPSTHLVGLQQVSTNISPLLNQQSQHSSHCPYLFHRSYSTAGRTDKLVLLTKLDSQ
jgi:hypothetical protein